MSAIDNSDVPSVGNWFWTVLVLGLPLIGLIMALYWAFAGGANPSKRNLCRAILIWWLVIIVFYILLFVFAGGMAMLGGSGAEMGMGL